MSRNWLFLQQKTDKIMKNVNAIIKNIWGDSPSPKVKTGFIPNLCDWEKKNYLTNPSSCYRQKASVGYIAMKGWLFTILRLPNCTFANQAFFLLPFPFPILNNQSLAIYKLYNHFWHDMKVIVRFVFYDLGMSHQIGFYPIKTYK